MSDFTGRFVWYELMTADVAAARDFYSRVVGWDTVDAQMPGMTYWNFTAEGKPFAGLMALPEEARNAGAPPHWMGYVAVPDVDAAAAKATATGGAVHVPPMDIPRIGRFAVVADPFGASIAVFRTSHADQDQPAAPDAPGRVGWHELYSDDQGKAFDFYAGLFGWVKKDAMDMGPMGTYQIFGTADTALGGMMNRPPNVPVCCWTYYFNVGNVDQAAERVKSAGGRVLHGPQEVPGGAFVLQCLDPQGAVFALVGTR